MPDPITASAGSSRRSSVVRLLIVTAVLLLIGARLAAPLGYARSTEDHWPRRVLLTNDDGIDSPGLLALATAFSEAADVWVVAPSGDRSGSTNYAVVLTGSVTLERRELGAGITAYAVDGYPSDCVVVALRGLMADTPPDLVVSGINAGANIADAWALSGTLGAARTAALAGVPAIAVSGGAPESQAVIAAWVAQLSRSEIVRQLGPLQMLTVDVSPSPEIGGVEVVRRAQGYLAIDLERGEDDPGAPGKQVWRASGVDRKPIDLDGTDVSALQRGNIALGIMRVDESDPAGLARLKPRAADLPAWPPKRR